MIEVLKQALEALEESWHLVPKPDYAQEAITSLRQAIAELESQEPVAWMDADGNVSDNNDHKCFPIPLYTHPPQRMEQEPVIMWPCHIIEADFHERTITLGMECGDYKVSAGTHWLSTHPPQRIEQNFCPRCGKRTNDIHTCTPPQIKTTDKFESAKVEDYNRGWNDCLFASGIVKQSQHTWVGLTDDDDIDWEEGGNLKDLVKAIEAKLKQKNGFTEENT
jgi:hypothetical protein